MKVDKIESKISYVRAQETLIKIRFIMNFTYSHFLSRGISDG